MQININTVYLHLMQVTFFPSGAPVFLHSCEFVFVMALEKHSVYIAIDISSFLITYCKNRATFSQVRSTAFAVKSSTCRLASIVE